MKNDDKLASEKIVAFFSWKYICEIFNDSSPSSFEPLQRFELRKHRPSLQANAEYIYVGSKLSYLGRAGTVATFFIL